MSAVKASDLLDGSHEPEYPDSFPPEDYYVHENDITQAQADKLSTLIRNESMETKVDSFIRENPVVLTSPLSWYQTGHHGAWVLSQQTLKPHFSSVSPGMVPDYIIGGRHSGGYKWWIVELKGPDRQMFVGEGTDIRLSSVLNEAICQTLRYIDYASEAQAHLRDQLELTNFREPNGLILIGRETELEENQQRQSLRAAINRVTDDGLTIRTYDSVLREVESKASRKSVS